MKRGDNMKTLAARARESERMHAKWRDPQWRLKAGYLLAHQRAEIVSAARSGIPFIEIALDYDVTVSNVCHIARKAGLSRQRG